MNKDSRIYVAGHRGMVGSAIVRSLSEKGFGNILTASKDQVNLLDYNAVNSFFDEQKPEYVFIAAARVGGIMANIDNPAVYLYENLQIQNNLIHLSYKHNIKKVCILGSSCIYPKECIQPMKEEYLFDGKLEPTNEGYALAKLAGIKLGESYHKQYGLQVINPIPCNLYGLNDSFDVKHSHVLSALIKKFVDAKSQLKEEVVIWGTGIARREFLNVDDLSWMVIKLMLEYNDPSPINIGSGKDISIKELAELIARKVDYTGNIIWDKTKPDGMLKKCMDVSKMNNLGIKPEITLEEGIAQMINNYKNIEV